MSAQDPSDHMLPGPIGPDHELTAPTSSVSVAVGSSSTSPEASSSSMSSMHQDVVHTPMADDTFTSQPSESATPSQSVPASSSRMMAAGLTLLTAVAVIMLGIMIVSRFPTSGHDEKGIPSGLPLEKEKGPIKVGGIMPLTGDAASYGIPYQKVAKLAEKNINASGGIGGRMVQIIWEDGQCEGTPAADAAKRLVEKQQVEYLIAGACSSEYLSAAPMAQAHKVISFSPSATSPQISRLGKYVFRTTPSDALAGRVAAEYATKRLHAKKAAVISEKSDYAQALREVFVKEFTRQGGTIVIDEEFDSGTTQMETIAKKTVAASPDVVYLLPQTVTPGVVLVNALKSHRIKAPLLTAEVLLIRDTVTNQAKVLEGVTGVEIAFDDVREETKKFFNAYKQEYGLDVNDPAYMSGMYDILYLIKEAREHTNGSPEAVSDYLYHLHNWQGAVGTISFDAHGDPTMSYAIRTIKNGQAELVENYRPDVTE